MTDMNSAAATPMTQLLAEILERLSAAQLLTVHGSVVEAAHALEDELRGIGPFATQDQAAAVLALRLAGWPPAQIASREARSALGDAAFGIQFLLATDDEEHVADFLRHAEIGGDSGSLRSIEALRPTASRAITEYRRLTEASKSPNER
jgi:hypothetical protein